ncbi:hypothetical protein TIFTF001_015803 [Ficus carica]|uniref:Uncharacterized GPI-anchored protein At5g19230-like domain-containing protein n=1 Tax=Ficus carica TaxID=3494 RepID=A0AA88A552_FICCA|nr:hypothetical protein TIFTF001_015803 [Ficus carica]
MASLIRSVLVPFLICSVLLLNHSVKCDLDEEDSLFQSINAYRTSLNLTTLLKNENAHCLADEVAEQFQNQPCTNTTGANTVPGTEPQLADYPNLLAKCHLNVSNTRDGVVLPACVPNLESTLVVSNFTKSQYSNYLNDTKFSGIGIGHEDNWIVVVLTTSTPEGSFVPSQDTSNGANPRCFPADDDVLDDDKDDDVDNDVNDDVDEEDVLLQSINAERAILKVAALINNKNADCFADEFADRFQDQPCSNTTGAITTPGTRPQLSNYPELLAKCNLNVSDGLVLPACAPKSDPNRIHSDLKSSNYSNSLNDPKYTGVGIGSEDDWLVVVLISNSTTGGIVPSGNSPVPANNGTNKTNAVGGVNAINAASFVPKMTLIHHFLLLLIASILLL